MGHGRQSKEAEMAERTRRRREKDKRRERMKANGGERRYCKEMKKETRETENVGGTERRGKGGGPRRKIEEEECTTEKQMKELNLMFGNGLQRSKFADTWSQQRGDQLQDDPRYQEQPSRMSMRVTAYVTPVSQPPSRTTVQSYLQQQFPNFLSRFRLMEPAVDKQSCTLIATYHFANGISTIRTFMTNKAFLGSNNMCCVSLETAVETNYIPCMMQM